MQLRVVDTNSIGTGLRVDLGADADLYLAKDIIVARTDGISWADYAISGTGSYQRADILGSVQSLGVAINLGDQEGDRGNVVRIHESGIVQSHLDNGTGVRMMGSALSLRNDGMIQAGGEGVVIGTYGTDTSTIVNYGTIESDTTSAIASYSSSTGTLIIRNYGEISGVASYRGVVATEAIYNNGLMNGTIDLGSGDDLYDGSKGTVVGGVYGGSGKDTLRGGAGAESFGGGYDNDLLYGNGGNDDLAGGYGADKLWGGKGADMFVFTDPGESAVAAKDRDTIMDFSQKQKDHIDLSDLYAISVPSLAKDSDGADLAFISTDKFHRIEGELRFFQQAGNTFLEADLDGNGKADFRAQMVGTFDLTAGDFIL